MAAIQMLTAIRLEHSAFDPFAALSARADGWLGCQFANERDDVFFEIAKLCAVLDIGERRLVLAVTLKPRCCIAIRHEALQETDRLFRRKHSGKGLFVHVGRGTLNA